jgi:hypothetical protein
VDCKTGYWINAGEGSVVRDNVAIACGSNHGAADLKVYENDPGFVNQAAMNLALREDAAVYGDVQGFEQIPFARSVSTPTSSAQPCRDTAAKWQIGYRDRMHRGMMYSTVSEVGLGGTAETRDLFQRVSRGG